MTFQIVHSSDVLSGSSSLFLPKARTIGEVVPNVNNLIPYPHEHEYSHQYSTYLLLPHIRQVPMKSLLVNTTHQLIHIAKRVSCKKDGGRSNLRCVFLVVTSRRSVSSGKISFKQVNPEEVEN